MNGSYINNLTFLNLLIRNCIKAEVKEYKHSVKHIVTVLLSNARQHVCMSRVYGDNLNMN